MNIPIKTNKKKFHREILETIKSIYPLSKLRKKELDLLAEIMLQFQICDIDKNKRKYVVFSTDGRKEMRDKLNISAGNMNTYLCEMRKYGILSKNNELNRIFDIPFREYKISYNFSL